MCPTARGITRYRAIARPVVSALNPVMSTGYKISSRGKPRDGTKKHLGTQTDNYYLARSLTPI